MIPENKKFIKKPSVVTPIGIMIAFVTLYSVMPMIPQLISDYLSTYIYMAFLLVVLVGVVLSDGFHTMIRYIVLLLPLVLYNFLNLVANHWAADFKLWAYGTLLDCLPLLFGVYLCSVKKKLQPFESKVLLFSVVVTMLTTVVGLARYPSAARMLATDTVENSPLLHTYNMANIGGYDFVYLLVLLYPILIYAYKRKKIKLLPAILLSAGIFFCVLASEYALALLFFVMSTVLFFVKRNFTRKRLLLLLLLSAVIILLLWTQVSRLITWSTQFIESEIVRERLLALAGGREGLNATDDKRLELYLRSIKTFLQQPILGRLTPGSSYLLAGGHSFILDALAEFGIVGGLVLFFVYRNIYNLFYRPLEKDSDYGFVYWCFLFPLIMSLLNTGMWGFYLMFAAPLLIRLVRGEESSPETAEAPVAPDSLPVQAKEPS